MGQLLEVASLKHLKRTYITWWSKSTLLQTNKMLLPNITPWYITTKSLAEKDPFPFWGLGGAASSGKVLWTVFSVVIRDGSLVMDSCTWIGVLCYRGMSLQDSLISPRDWVYIDYYGLGLESRDSRDWNHPRRFCTPETRYWYYYMSSMGNLTVAGWCFSKRMDLW